MATATRKSATRKTAAAKAKTTKAATTKKTTGKGKTTAKSAATEGPSKRELLAEQNAANTERMLELREAGSSWSQIAEELSITPGKAQFLMMLHKVAEGEVPKITFRNDGELTTKAAAARRKADEFSSWGWIAARTGVSEGKLKGLLEESGDYVPKSENISIVRAEKNGGGKAATKSTGKGKTTTKTTTAAKKKATGVSAKAAAAKKRAAARAGKGKSS